MTPLDAAKALVGQSEPVSPIGYGSTRVLCRTKLGDDHEPDCPWPHLPAIIAALEAAQAVVDRAFFREDGAYEGRAPGYTDALKALARAMKGTVPA